jgi:hypothetical protein
MLAAIGPSYAVLEASVGSNKMVSGKEVPPFVLIASFVFLKVAFEPKERAIVCALI